MLLVFGDVLLTFSASKLLWVFFKANDKLQNVPQNSPSVSVRMISPRCPTCRKKHSLRISLQRLAGFVEWRTKLIKLTENWYTQCTTDVELTRRLEFSAIVVVSVPKKTDWTFSKLSSFFPVTKLPIELEVSLSFPSKPLWFLLVSEDNHWVSLKNWVYAHKAPIGKTKVSAILLQLGWKLNSVFRKIHKFAKLSSRLQNSAAEKVWDWVSILSGDASKINWFFSTFLSCFPMR